MKVLDCDFTMKMRNLGDFGYSYGKKSLKRGKYSSVTLLNMSPAQQSC